jgi:hypothetical protein
MPQALDGQAVQEGDLPSNPHQTSALKSRGGTVINYSICVLEQRGKTSTKNEVMLYRVLHDLGVIS